MHVVDIPGVASMMLIVMSDCYTPPELAEKATSGLAGYCVMRAMKNPSTRAATNSEAMTVPSNRGSIAGR